MSDIESSSSKQISGAYTISVRPRFSLRTAFVTLTIVALAIGLPIAALRRQCERKRHALQQLIELKVNWSFANEASEPWWKWQARTWIDEDAFRTVPAVYVQPGAGDWDEIGVHLSEIHELELLCNDSPGMKDRHVEVLYALGSLRRLVINNGEFTPKPFQPLLRVKKWQQLQLPVVAFDDRMLAEVSQMNKLGHFAFDARDATTTGILSLRSCQALQSLEVSHATQLADGIEPLARSRKLRRLIIKNSVIGAEGIKSLMNLPQPCFLGLDQCLFSRKESTLPLIKSVPQRFPAVSTSKADDDLMGDVSRIVGLKLLGFAQTDLSDTGLQRLAACRSLVVVRLPENTRCTEAGIRQFQSAIPVEVTIGAVDDESGISYQPGGKVEDRRSQK